MNNHREIKMRDLRISESEIENYSLIIKRIMRHGQFILGPENEEFEEYLISLTGSKHAIGVASCSSGLYLSLRSLRLNPGDEIITTPMSWLVSSSAIVRAGGVPVFVDVDGDYNIDFGKIKEAYSSKTKGVLVVHFYGKIVDKIDEIKNFCEARKIWLIEDCAQSVGAKLNNTYSGTFGDFGVYSFSPMKVIPSFGDAGAVLLKGDSKKDIIKSLKHCGTTGDLETAIDAEIKHNLDPIHAAIAGYNLKRADQILDNRRKIAYTYLESLSKLDKDAIVLPSEGIEGAHTWYDFTIRSKYREKLMDFLKKNMIHTAIRHPKLISDQPGIPGRQAGALENAKKYVDEIMCLPIYNTMKMDDAEYVSDKINEFFTRKLY